MKMLHHDWIAWYDRRCGYIIHVEFPGGAIYHHTDDLHKWIDLKTYHLLTTAGLFK